MSRSRIPDVDVSTSPIKARPPAVRPPSARINSARARSAQQQQPIKHEPCSSTLAKFHDSVNFSVLGDAHATRQSPRHPILEAKEKYKYMPRQKSYCDESLFASNTPRLNHDNHYAGNLPSFQTCAFKCFLNKYTTITLREIVQVKFLLLT